MHSFHNRVILFTRYPCPGRCKTRLIPTLGPEGAARIYQQLVTHTLKTLTDFISWQNSTELVISHDGGSRRQMETWLGTQFRYQEQHGQDLGQRMADALFHGLNNAQNCILIGSDCPDITASILADALQALQQEDMVLGPAHDGGYYLIGMAAPVAPSVCSRIFKKISWGSDTVFAETLTRACKLDLSSHILKTLHDIDTVEDLKYFHHCSHPE